jgi:hypothetical protein
MILQLFICDFAGKPGAYISKVQIVQQCIAFSLMTRGWPELYPESIELSR